MTPRSPARIAFTATAEPPHLDPATTLAVTFVAGGCEPLEPTTSLDAVGLGLLGFTGAPGESFGRALPSGASELLVGIGPLERLDAEILRLAGAGCIRAAVHAKSLVIDLRSLGGHLGRELDVAAATEALVEGAGLGAYRFSGWQGAGVRPAGGPAVVYLVSNEPGAAQRGAERGAVVVEAVSLARDLVNEPPSSLTPRRFAEVANEVAQVSGLSIEVLDEVGIAAAGLGGLMGVAAGSAEPPRLVRLSYDPGAGPGGSVGASESSSAPGPRSAAERGGPPATVALVGKGITFDSGGLSLKSAAGMMTMKTDMSGGAAVLAAMSVLGRLGVGVKVIGIVALTENMPSGTATKPGDVLSTRNGKTIEVLNTDAEGRLVLADALALAAEAGPDAIVDLATLTGACVVALGASIAGLMSNDDRLVHRLLSASARSGERLWHLPLPSAYRSQLDSEVADMKNVGAEGKAGALVAGLVLSEFVGEVPWAHLDIAGPARSEEDRGILRKGATGFGVRTLLELLEHWSVLGGPAAGAKGA